MLVVKCTYHYRGNSFLREYPGFAFPVNAIIRQLNLPHGLHLINELFHYLAQVERDAPEAMQT